MNTSLKRILHWAGSTLSVAGIVFVALRLNDYSTQLDFSRFNVFMCLVVIGFTLIYGLVNIMLALAWRNLLLYFGALIPRLYAVKIYGLTQLAKYVPGNIMHLASRQAMGLAAGVQGWPLAKASIWELGLISVTGAFFGILTLPRFLPAVTTPIATVGFVGVLFFIAVGLKRYVSVTIAQALGWYTVFLTVSGMVYVGLLALLMGNGSLTVSQMLPYCGAFVVAWLAGLVTPGAPAGVGVRELVLMKMLGGLVPEPDLLLAILISRAVTVGGDLLFFLFSVLISRREH